MFVHRSLATGTSLTEWHLLQFNVVLTFAFSRGRGGRGRAIFFSQRLKVIQNMALMLKADLLFYIQNAES